MWFEELLVVAWFFRGRTFCIFPSLCLLNKPVCWQMISLFTALINSEMWQSSTGRAVVIPITLHTQWKSQRELWHTSESRDVWTAEMIRFNTAMVDVLHRVDVGVAETPEPFEQNHFLITSQVLKMHRPANSLMLAIGLAGLWPHTFYERTVTYPV